MLHTHTQRSSCITLIECGADVNHCDSTGLTALHVACYHGNREVLGALLSKKASVDIKDKLVSRGGKIALLCLTELFP